jgi:MtfA peptidase
VPFIGCAGLEVTDEMRVLVAMQAALPKLGLGDDAYPALRQVLLYPGPFVVPRQRSGDGGIVHEGRDTLAGESWQQGQVLLSWHDVLAGAAMPDDGENVVIHEFAHQIDQAHGAANGAPWLPGARRSRQWARVWSAEFAALRERVARGQFDLLGAYAASAPAECFAVASERFYEMPEALAAAYPRIYAELRALYGADPRQWRNSRAGWAKPVPQSLHRAAESAFTAKRD